MICVVCILTSALFFRFLPSPGSLRSLGTFTAKGLLLPHEGPALFFRLSKPATKQTMSAGVFNSGRQWATDKAFRNLIASSSLHVGLYTNAAESLTNRNVLADIIPCAGSGYAPVALAAADWTTAIELGATPSLDVVTVTRPDVIFTASAEWGVVNGAYLFDSANGLAIAWRDGVVPYDMTTGAKYLVDWLTEIF